MKRHQGQSLTEYTLIGALVLLVSIGALTLLGKGTSNMFTSMLPIQHRATVAAVPINAPSPALVPASGSNAIPAMMSPAPSLASPITVDTVPKTSADLIMTVGANGASQTALAFTQLIMQTAQPYQKSEPAAYNAIVALGLKGQGMAQVMKTCEVRTCDPNKISNAIADVTEAYNAAYDLQKQLKPSDVELIANLTNESTALADDLTAVLKNAYDPSVYHTSLQGSDGTLTNYPIGQAVIDSSLTSSSNTVNNNSTVTKQCGLTMACSP